MSEQDRTEKSNSIVQGETEEPQTNQMGICGLDTEHCKEVQSIGMARIPSEKDTIAGRPDRGQNPCGQIMKELQARTAGELSQEKECQLLEDCRPGKSCGLHRDQTRRMTLMFNIPY